MTAVLRAHQALQAAGLQGPLPPGQPAPGAPVRVTNAINEVWHCGAYMLRVNPRPGATRLQHEAALLCRLPPGVLAPQPVAAGSAPWGEWMVATRLPGQELSRAWSGLGSDERQRAITELGAALRVLHGTPTPADMPPISLVDCPHALPVRRLLALIAESGDLPGVDRAVMEAVADRLVGMADALDDDAKTLVHGDLHLENVLAGPGGVLTGVLDFEWSRPGPPDLDLDVLLHSLADPSLHLEGGSGGRLQRRDFDEVVGWLGEAYPELLSHPRLAERLWVYRLAYDMHALMAQPPPAEARAGSLPPHHPYQRIRRLLEDRSDLGWFISR
jgi:aminoglycoside phosphotransferase (APT) family kinase protein